MGLNVLQKINEVKKVAYGFKKDKKGFNYEYVSGNQILGAIKDKMQEIGLLLMPGISHINDYSKFEYDKTSYDKFEKCNKTKHIVEFIVYGTMTYSWINCEDPTDKYEVSWAFFGQQDDISKAFGSGLTYSERYYLLKSLGLPTDEDDPDAKRPIENKTNGTTDITEPESENEPNKNKAKTNISTVDLDLQSMGIEPIDLAHYFGVTLDKLTEEMKVKALQRKCMSYQDIHITQKELDAYRDELKLLREEVGKYKKELKEGE